MANPQAPPASAQERERRLKLVAEFERRVVAEPATTWVQRFRTAGAPASEVRLLEQLFEHDQVRANGLVQTVAHDGVGPVKLLGSLFKIDGVVAPAARSIPALGEHTEEVLAECRHDAGLRAIEAQRVRRERRRRSRSSGRPGSRHPGQPTGHGAGSSSGGRRSPKILSSFACAGLGAVEMGRRLAPLQHIDRLLGGGPIAGDLVRSLGAERVALVRELGVVHRRPVVRSEPVASADGLDVHRVLELGEKVEVSDEAAETAERAWMAATVGYLAGLGQAALDLTVDYVRQRRAFRTTLAALAPVQQLPGRRRDRGARRPRCSPPSGRTPTRWPMPAPRSRRRARPASRSRARSASRSSIRCTAIPSARERWPPGTTRCSTSLIQPPAIAR